MKKIIILSAAAVLIAGSLEARGWNRAPYPVHHQVYYGGHGNWVAPLIIGGMLGYTLSRPDVVYTPSPTVIYTTSPRVMSVDGYQSTAPIRQSVEIIAPDSAVPMYEERWVYFDDCQCERKVLISTQP